MKKSLVLAMAMALGVTASAYAANPFSDVPAGHWAYDSISKLAAAGVIEGYGDDTFRGDRLMTRYEMAQIVARAMAKGANVDKLAAEFADELDKLNVRVAALEKKADNVKINGQIRWRWALGTPAQANKPTRERRHDMRSRIWFNGQINSGWKYVAMLENVNSFITDNAPNNTDQNTQFQRAFVTGRLGGVKVKAGRDNENIMGGDSDVYMNRVDEIRLTYGDKFKVSGWYGKPTAANGANGPYSQAYGVRLSYDWDKWGAFAEYDKFSSHARPVAVQNPRDLWGIGVNGKFGDFGAKLMFLHGNIKNNNAGKKNGWTLELSYKGAQAAKPGTWGLAAKYYDQGDHTYFAAQHGLPAIYGAWLPRVANDGFRGFRLTGSYTFAKNIVGSVSYIDLKGKGNGGTKAKTAYTQVVFTF